MKIAEEFFDMGSRSEKESREIQELNDSILRQFIQDQTPSGQVETKTHDKLQYLRYFPQEIRNLPTDRDKRFIVIGIILNQKTLFYVLV